MVKKHRQLKRRLSKRRFVQNVDPFGLLWLKNIAVDLFGYVDVLNKSTFWTNRRFEKVEVLASTLWMSIFLYRRLNSASFVPKRRNILTDLNTPIRYKVHFVTYLLMFLGHNSSSMKGTLA